MSLPDPSSESIALVTGASSGIGEEFARQLSQLGHRVALVARREERLRELAGELGGDERAVVLSADLASPEDRDRLAGRIDELGAQVDILVNNAGFGIFKPFAESGHEAEVKQLRVLSEAVVDLMARYLPGMVKRGRGAVINVASTAGFQPLPYNAGYSAAKAHVLMLSEAVHAEVKDQETSDASYFADKLPKFTFVEPERVARDAIRAAAQGRISVIPGGLQVRAAYGPNRKLPRWLTLPVSKRLMTRG
jgi:short-subunit dehydrogenase